MAKKKVEEKINLDSILFKCRDILRQARNSGSFFEKRDMMLTLVFLRFIGEKFEDGIQKLRQDLIAQGLDPDDEEIFAAFFDDATFTDGTYNLPVEARWSTIINTPAPQLNVALDTALHSLATSSKQLKGCFVEGTFMTRNLAANDIKKIVDEVNKISHKAFGEEKDLIGRVYEYFLKEFAVNATKEEGEFYTPHDAVQLIAAMIEPFDGTLYDPCCGSGGMFIQSADLIKAKQGDISRINIYGQEKEPATYRLAKMNLALYDVMRKGVEGKRTILDHSIYKKNLTGEQLRQAGLDVLFAESVLTNIRSEHSKQTQAIANTAEHKAIIAELQNGDIAPERKAAVGNRMELFNMKRPAYETIRNLSDPKWVEERRGSLQSASKLGELAEMNRDQLGKLISSTAKDIFIGLGAPLNQQQMGRAGASPELEQSQIQQPNAQPQPEPPKPVAPNMGIPG